MKAVALKQTVRSLMGDDIATWIHATRFWWWAQRGRQAEIDMALAHLFLREGEVAVDVGANGADWTFLLSHLAGKNGHVFAFEADPYYAEVTRKTLALLRLNNVTLFPFGLSDRREEALFEILNALNERVSGTGRVVREPVNLEDRPNRFLKVRLEPLDDVARAHPMITRVRLLKCDVEGFELMVFRGARNILRQARPIVIAEVGGAAPHGYSDTEVFDFFRLLNYDCYVVVSENLLRPSGEPGDLPEGSRPNRIMIPREFPVDQKHIDRVHVGNLD